MVNVGKYMGHLNLLCFNELKDMQNLKGCEYDQENQ